MAKAETVQITARVPADLAQRFRRAVKIAQADGIEVSITLVIVDAISAVTEELEQREQRRRPW